MNPPQGTVTLIAPAKLTLGLRITGVREDGYHLIDAEMVSLDLHDVLEVTPAATTTVRHVVDGEEVAAYSDDLVGRALRHCGVTGEVVVHKRIPAGAGLGGGSSDAAAVLWWAGHTDPHEAVALGADVPFCLRGGRARVRGVGEDLQPLRYQERTVTLYTPPLHCSTPEVYRRWDAMGGPRGEHGNDLEPAALSVEPELARARDRLEAATGQRPRLAGSGSTWYVDGAFSGEGLVVARTTPSR